MAYTTIDDPSIYFNTVLYTGNGSTGHAITGVNHQPDIVWIKNRDAGNALSFHDSARGVTKRMIANTNAAEDTTDPFTSFDSDGFTLNSTGGGVNGNTENYVSWNFKESADAGIDIVLWTGNGSARTISHSLSAVPSFMTTFCRSTGYHHATYHHKNTSAPETEILYLNLENVSSDDSSFWNDTAPTSSVFSVGTDNSVNQSSETYVGYLFSEKKGFSKFGGYVGSGNADGPFIYIGFRPQFVIIKKVDGAPVRGWVMEDTKRSLFNGMTRNNKIEAAADSTSTGDAKDFLSNGFKLHDITGDWFNASGTNYIYIAFAESPFVNSKGVPTNAR